jgi:hypothetical protein
MIREHYAAVKALIPTSPRYVVHLGAARGKVTDGVLQPLTYPYVVLWGDLGTETTEALSATPDTLEMRIRATYVALGFEQLADVATLVRAALSQSRPAVAGWAPGRLQQQSLMDAQTDYDVTLTDKSNPMYAVDEYLLSSQRS